MRSALLRGERRLRRRWGRLGGVTAERGVCMCWDGHIGVDCNYSLEESVNLYLFLGMIVVVSIISFFFMWGCAVGFMVDCA